MSKYKLIDEVIFSKMIGVNLQQLPTECKKLLSKYKLSYRFLTKKERDQVLLKVIKRITSPEKKRVGEKYKQVWEKGWEENLQSFIDSNYNLNELVPKFIKPNQPVRFFSEYVLPSSDHFELNYYTIFRLYLFITYLKDPQTIYEFGCGTGYNLIELSKLYPTKDLYGADWTKASKKILKIASEKYKLPIKGSVFNMFRPDLSFKMKPDSAVLVIGALEQLGTKFKPFIDYILEQQTKIVVHVDSIIELYDKDNLMDYLAYYFDQKRNYLKGYLPYLKKLENQGKIEILKIQRSPFGSLFHDGYSYIIWRAK